MTTQASPAKREIKAAMAELLAAHQALAELCRQSGCDSPDRLAAAEEQSRERRQAETGLRALESELIEGVTCGSLAAVESDDPIP